MTSDDTSNHDRHNQGSEPEPAVSDMTTDERDEKRIAAWRAERQAIGEKETRDRAEKRQAEHRARSEEDEEVARQGAANRIPDQNALQMARGRLLQQRRRDNTRSRRIFALIVVGPFIISFIHQFLLVPSLYMSESIFSIYTSRSDTETSVPEIFGIGGLSGSERDAYMVREYILSRSMMVQMEKEGGFMSHLEKRTPQPDEEPGSFGDFGTYLRHVKVSYDTQQGVLRLRVFARSPEAASGFSLSLLELSEQRVNDLSQSILEDQIALTTSEVERAEKNLMIARQNVVDLQIRHGDFNPRETVGAINKYIQSLEEKLKEVERSRNLQLASQIRNSPGLNRLDTEIIVLGAQIEEQRNLLFGNDGNESLNDILSQYEAAVIQRDISQKRWEVSLQSLEKTREQGLLQRRYLTVVTPPLEPKGKSTSPRWRNVMLTLAISLILYFVISIFTTAIRVRSSSL